MLIKLADTPDGALNCLASVSERMILYATFYKSVLWCHKIEVRIRLTLQYFERHHVTDVLEFYILLSDR